MNFKLYRRSGQFYTASLLIPWALMGAFLPNDAGILKYQDLSYKINLPTKQSGTFSWWGVGAYDGMDTEAEEREDWEAMTDRGHSQTTQYMYATGFSHKIFVGEKSVLNTALSAAGNGLDFDEQRLDDDLQEQPQAFAKNDNYKFTLQSSWTNYLSKKHTHRTGFYYTHLGYNLNVKQSPSEGLPPVELSAGKGQTDLFQVYSASKISMGRALELNGGIHLLHFRLNQEFSVEPRVALKYHINKNQSLALAYGLHSRIEELPVYFVNTDGTFPNKDLKLMKANHWVLSYHSQLAENLNLSLEPYYQYLTNVPVAPDSYISTLNIRNSLFFDEPLVNDGTARNLGVDVTLERFLKNGMCCLLSASVFDPKYTPADGIERNTRLNKKYVVNALIGKEWHVGKNKNNVFSANLRMNYLGGNEKNL